MDTRSRRSHASDNQPAAPCAQCGNRLFAPEWSEQLSETRVRHLWECHACGYSFETLVVFAHEAEDRAA
jgi:primosomal protein N'